MAFDSSILSKAEKAAFQAFSGSPVLPNGSYNPDYIDAVRSAKALAGELIAPAVGGGAVIPQTSPRSRGDAGEPLQSTASPFDQSPQTMSSGLVYPSDLQSPDYAGGTVTFFINVNEDSYIAKQNKDLPVVQPARSANSGGIDRTRLNAVAGITGATIGGGLAGQAIGSLGGVGLPATQKAEAAAKIAGVIGGGLTGVAMAESLLPQGKPKSYKRLGGAIMLHIPTDLSITYSAGWEVDNQAGMNALVGGEDSKAAARGLSSYVTGLALQTAPGGFVGKAAGVASNPKKEQLFRNVNFREFTFSYQFFARSAGEWSTIKEIIKMFKLHMHPEFKPDSENFLYIYPSEFEIVYNSPALHKHTACVLTNMTVNYTPNNIWSAFNDNNPTQVNMQLQFRELALLTKEDIEGGY